jgi:hypothetical protein
MNRFAIRFLGWTAVGFTGAFSFIAGFSIGLFVLPLFLVLLGVMLATRRSEDDGTFQPSGVFLGFALMAVLLLAINPGWWQLAPIAVAFAILAVGIPSVNELRKS